jgi:hypothetical protein
MRLTSLHTDGADRALAEGALQPTMCLSRATYRFAEVASEVYGRGAVQAAVESIADNADGCATFDRPWSCVHVWHEACTGGYSSQHDAA